MLTLVIAYAAVLTLALSVTVTTNASILWLVLEEKGFSYSCSDGGVSIRKMEKLLQSLGIECVSASLASKMTERRNEEAKNFREHSLARHSYPVLWADALYKRIRTGGKVVSRGLTALDTRRKPRM